MSDNGWIPVSERLPEPNTEVMACVRWYDEGSTGVVPVFLRYRWEKASDGVVDWRDSWNHDEIGNDEYFEVTHWMLMPKLPEV